MPSATANNNGLKKPSLYFQKLAAELNLDKYDSAKNRALFELTSFQNMHDADLAYHYAYLKCAENAWNKEALTRCLEHELKTMIKNPDAFNTDIYMKNMDMVLKGITRQLNSGSLDYLFL